MKIVAILMIVFSLFLSCCVNTNPVEEDEISPTEEVTQATEIAETIAAEQTTPVTEPLPPIHQEAPHQVHTVSPDAHSPVAEATEHQSAGNRKPTPPERPSFPTEQDPPTEQTEPAPAEPTAPLPTETEPVPTEAPPTEQTMPDPPAVCRHSWVPIQNIPAQYETQYYVVCHCGAVFSDTTAWAAHRDEYLGSTDLTQHTGYATGSSKTETAPAMVVWQCSQCGAAKTINAQDNP